MKWIIISVILCMTAAQAMCQTMTVHLKDGTTLYYDVDSVARLNFLDDSLPYDYRYELNAYSEDSGLQRIATRFIDSIVVRNENGRYLFIAGTNFGDPFSAHYQIERMDSITFSRSSPLPTSADTNPNVNMLVALSSDYQNFFMSAWASPQRIYAAETLHEFDIDSTVKERSAQDLFPGRGGPTFLSKNTNKNHLLAVLGGPPPSTGYLAEIDLSNLTLSVLDSGMVSSAVYVTDSGNIVFYSYGSYSIKNPKPTDAGYYLIDRTTGKKTLLLNYISDAGPQEVINGFDISADGTELLIPLTSSAQGPIIVQYSFNNHNYDTIPVVFGNSKKCLWVRYNSDDSKVLYCNYSIDDFIHVPTDPNEIGIINLADNHKEILATEPLEIGTWISVFPQWSPDNSSIVYGSAVVETEPPSMGKFYLCVLKSLN